MTQDPKAIEQFLREHPSVKYVRLQWFDFGSIMRVMVFPAQQVWAMAKNGKWPGVPNVALMLLQTDQICPGFAPVGEHKLYPDFESLRLGPHAGYATVQVELREKNGEEVPFCPRTLLRNIVKRASDVGGKEFLLGFEIEVIFIKPSVVEGKGLFERDPADQGHAWLSSRALQDDRYLSLLGAIMEQLEASSIPVQKFHPECTTGQYEFVLAPLAPLVGVDTLLAARDIIQTTAARFSLRATFVPKPYPEKVGTGCHVHISMTPPDQHESFLAGLLKHLRAITAFTYGNSMSFQRTVNSLWAGGSYVAWGTQNRETPLRRIEGSHFELRCMDGFANPYLALSAVLGAGFQAVLDGEPLTKPDCQADPANLTDQEREDGGITELLPVSMSEALGCLREDEGLGKILGKAVVEHHLGFKKAEYSMLEKIDDSKLWDWLIQRY